MGEVTLFKGGVPAFLKKAGADDVTNALAGSTGNGMRRISIKGNVFRQMIGGKEHYVSEDRAMNVIIIKAAPTVSRTYFKGSYVEGEATAPSCWSTDSQKPDAEVKNPQSNTCLKCPMNIKGSGQGETRACRYSQRVAVLVEGDLENEEVYQLVLPATSIFGEADKGKMPLRAYAEFLKREDAPMSGVVTEMKFDLASPTPKLVFRPIRAVDEEEWEIIQRLKESDEAQKAVELTVSQTDGVKEEEEAPKPKKKALPAPVIEEDEDEEEEAPKPKKKAKPAPVVEEEDEDEEEEAPAPVKKKKAKPVVEEEDDEDEVEEPKKATVKKKAAASEPQSLVDMVDDWDDE